MPFRVAPDDMVVAAARRVLEREKRVTTLQRLRDLVEAELRDEDEAFGLTPTRLRRLLALEPFVQLEYKTRRGGRERALHRCPVCGDSLSRVKNQTLFGGEVTLVQRCDRCGYWTGKDKRVPTVYSFHYRKPKS